MARSGCPTVPNCTKAHVFFFQSHCFEHFEHVAVSRAGGIERESLAAQIFEARDARIGHQNVVVDGVVLRGDENAVAASRHEPDQAFGAALVDVNLARGQCRHHYPVALDVGHLEIDAVFGEQALVEADPERREAAADRRVAEVYGGELLFLRWCIRKE